MGSINRSHNEADGGILLFNGELILLYCDSVHCELGGKESFKGRVYLTTHRLVVIVTPYRQNAPVKSLCAPFCAIARCNVEQPIFGANYIEATVRDETDSSKSFSFKLKFSKGGAIELAMAMNRAVSSVGRNFNPSMPPPPAYTPPASAQYYQAPPTVYAPGYNSGVQMPIQQFPDQPPIGFIYASSEPAPYPGLGPQGAPQAAPAQQNYPGYPTAGGYPANPGYPPQPQHQQQHQGGGGGGAGYPPQHQAPGYPPQQPPPSYPQQQPQQQQPGPQPTPQAHTGYPMGQQTPYGSAYPPPPPTSGYPPAASGQQQPQPGSAGYPPAQAAGAPPANPSQSSSAYPDLSQETSGQSAWPSAPSFNPNWQEDKKSS